MTNEELLSFLRLNKDDKYKIFNDKIINTKKKTIGVRTPIIKNLAKKIIKEDYNAFLNNIKDDYYEQILLKGFVISYIKNISEMLEKLDLLINKIDNWAICDLVVSNCKLIKKHQDEAFLFIKNNITSSNPWRVRVCFVMLLNYFVTEDKLESIFSFIEGDPNDFYYVMMAKAWLISECYFMYPKETLTFLKKTKINNKTYNKAIDKICDSKRVKKIDKLTLKKMKKSRIIA